ncbi:hypothetical protein EXW62_16100 [Bacillus mycoides]|nr:hypothetical protein EXW62_16100 [Bacillus mycoides]
MSFLRFRYITILSYPKRKYWIPPNLHLSRASPQMRQLLLQKKQKKLSDYKAVYMIQDHL